MDIISRPLPELSLSLEPRSLVIISNETTDGIPSGGPIPRDWKKINRSCDAARRTREGSLDAHCSCPQLLLNVNPKISSSALGYWHCISNKSCSANAHVLFALICSGISIVPILLLAQSSTGGRENNFLKNRSPKRQIVLLSHEDLPVVHSDPAPRHPPLSRIFV